MKNKLIALDADGVLLDFDAAYVNLWEKIYGYRPKELNPEAYWAFNRYDIPYLKDEELAEFKANFDDHFWENVPALPGAVQAVNRLYNAGYDIVCVSALPEQYAEQRQLGLYKQGFPPMSVFAVGAPADATQAHGNPKAKVLNSLKPICFVDDYLAYHEGVSDATMKVLIDRNPVGSPNHDLEIKNRVKVDMTCKNLVEFSNWFLDEGNKYVK